MVPYGWIAGGTNTIENEDRTLKITYADTSSGAHILLKNHSDNLSTNLTVGALYMFECTASISSLSSANIRVQTDSGVSIYANDIVPGATINVNDNVGKPYRCIFKASHVTDDRITFNNLSSGEILYIKNASLYAITGTSCPLWGHSIEDADIEKAAP